MPSIHDLRLPSMMMMIMMIVIMLIVITEPSRIIIIIISTNTSKYPIRCSSSFQFKMVSMPSEKSICAPSRLSEVSPRLPLKRFQCSSDWRWPSLVLSRRSSSTSFFNASLFQAINGMMSLALCPLWSSSTLEIFREASHLWVLLCPPVCLLGHFPSLRHVQGSTPTGVFKGGCRPSTHSSLGFPFHFSLNSSLNRSGICRRFCCYDH